MHSVGLISGNPGDRTGLELDLGFTYSSEPSVSAGHGYVPSGSPGGRAPHLWLGPQKSTLDLFGPGFALLAGARDGAWCDAANALAKQRAPHVVANKMPDGAWSALYGVDETGAVLVRPDGHVAWRRARAAGSDPTAELAAAVDAALGRTS
jgi:tetracenomycin A2 monooxygenase-dioxygenase